MNPLKSICNFLFGTNPEERRYSILPNNYGEYWVLNREGDLVFASKYLCDCISFTKKQRGRHA